VPEKFANPPQRTSLEGPSMTCMWRAHSLTLVYRRSRDPASGSASEKPRFGRILPGYAAFLSSLPSLSIQDRNRRTMMFGILADTHDQVARTRAAVERLKDAGAEILIHCGDITTPDVVYELAPLPSYFVFGNCDFKFNDLRRAIVAIGGTCLERGGLIELGGHRLAVTHGDSEKELTRLQAARPEYLLSGHTHQARDVRRGPTRFINPGALHRAATWTVGLLDCSSGRMDTLPIINTMMGG
jgi:uncharacterized protein